VSVLVPLLVVLVGVCALVAGVNYFVDPAGLYHPGRARQGRNLRLRKLALLKGLTRRPAATLVLGSSRVFNLALGGNPAFPQPVLNFAVTTAKAEDYLAGYRLVREAQAAPRLVLVGIEHPAFHPSMPAQWEAYTAGRYTQELGAIGAVRVGPRWRWAMLLSPLHFHQSLIELQRQARVRGGVASLLLSGQWQARPATHKFRWQADGSATWTDLLEGKRNPRLLKRQLRNFPRTGLGVRTYRRVGAWRLEWFTELLVQCRAEGAQVVAYIVPAHPLLVQRTWDVGFRPVHGELVRALEAACIEHGAQFRDWFDGAALGLTPEHFRDVMHLTDDGQEVVAEALSKLVTHKS
jgi:hypothetical protein